MSNQVAYQQQVDNAAELYDRAFVPAIAEPVSGRLIELAELQPGERVLDLACGSGIIARKVATAVGPTGTVVGVDVSPEMIAVAHARTRPGDMPIEWHVADASSLPLDSGRIDCVTCQMGLMLVDRAAALSEVRRVLRRGGRFVLNTPGTIQPPFEVLERALAQHVSPDLGGFVRAVFSLHDADELTAILGDAGFGDIHVESRTVPLAPSAPEQFLVQYLGSTPLGPIVASAPVEAQRALADDVVARWQAFVGDDGRLVLDQPMVYATAVWS